MHVLFLWQFFPARALKDSGSLAAQLIWIGDADRAHQQINLPLVEGTNSVARFCLSNWLVREIVLFGLSPLDINADTAAITAVLDDKGVAAADSHLERPSHQRWVDKLQV